MNTTATTPPTTIRRGSGGISRRDAPRVARKIVITVNRTSPTPTAMWKVKMSISSCDTETRTLRTTSTPISSTTITAIATSTPAASPARTPASATWRGSSATSPSARRRGRAARYPTRSGGVHTRIFPSVIWIPTRFRASNVVTMPTAEKYRMAIPP